MTESPAVDTMMPTPWRTDSDREEPMVYHGYTATAEMPCMATRNDRLYVSTVDPRNLLRFIDSSPTGEAGAAPLVLLLVGSWAFCPGL